MFLVFVEFVDYSLGRRGLGTGVERCSRASQLVHNGRSERVLATEHAPRGPFRLLERLHALAKIVERRAVVLVERLRVIRPHQERQIKTISEDTSRHGHRFAQECFGFCVAL